MSNPFNPQWLGFSSATDKQIMGGSAPFVYNYMPHDSQSCITAKSMFNQRFFTITKKLPSLLRKKLI